MSATPVSYFIYYRVAEEHRGEAQSRLVRIFAAIERELGICGRAYRRRDDARTWMEIYEDVHDSAQFEALLAATIEGTAFRVVLEPGTQRHVERFVGLGRSA